jgi:uncharacterized protein (DUF2141 family)
MKKVWLLLFALVLVVSVVSCGGDEAEPTPTTGTISGTLSLQAGMSGDLNNTRVAIYADLVDWANDLVLASVGASGSGGSATFALSNVTPGTYYLDAWKDVNNNQLFDAGDLYGWYGSATYPGGSISPLMVSAGQTTTVTIQMIVLQ